MTSGRDKGIAFERKICVELSSWWTKGKDDSVFWRSNASGARATVRAKKGKQTSGQYGDITAIDPVGVPFLAMSPVECKRGYPKVSIQDLLDQQEGRKQITEFEGWIEQARDAFTDSPYAVGWLLITSRYSKQTLVWFPAKLGRLLSEEGARLDTASLKILVVHKKKSICGMPLKSFLSLVKPEHYISLYEKGKAE